MQRELDCSRVGKRGQRVCAAQSQVSVRAGVCVPAAAAAAVTAAVTAAVSTLLRLWLAQAICLRCP